MTNSRVYLARKAATLALSIFLVTSLNFVIFQVLPGNPENTILPRGRCAGAQFNLTALCAQLRQAWGLDRPIHERYIIYMWNLLQGNWGTSITYAPGHDVWEIITPKLQSTLLFTGLATLISIWLGIRLGRTAGWRRGRVSESALTFASLVAYSVPTFWLALALIMAFAVYIRVFPTGGEVTPQLHSTLDLWGQIADRAIHMVLPLTAFVLNNYAIFTLIMRNSIVEELSEDYVTTARAKGLGEILVLKRHVIPNARLPVITLVSLYIGWILSGAIVIEAVFEIDGIGLLTIDAIERRDYPLLSAVFLLGTLGVVVANTVTDIAYSYFDPRVKEA